MINLLPESKQRALRNTRWLRTSIIALCCILAIELIAGVLYLPTFYLLWSREQVLQSELDSRKQNAPTNMQRAQGSMEALVEDLATLHVSGTTTPRALIDALAGARDEGVTIVGIVYDRERMTMEVRGYAATRNALIAYRTALRALAQVASAEIPTSLLVNEKDIDFTMRITLTGAPTKGAQ